MIKSPIRKLNRRLIYLCLMGSALVAIPLLIIPMAHADKSKEEGAPHNPAQAFAGGTDDAFALSGTERFPKDYGAIKGFEKEIGQAKPESESDAFALAFDKLSKLDKRVPQENGEPTSLAGHRSDNPRQEARKAEQKRREQEHYDAMRSDILFVNNKQSNNEGSSHRNTNSMMDAVERSLELAEKHLNQGPQKNDMFFSNKAQESARGPIGKIKEALPHMISEGTLIPTILLSEIDTSLPGPILARVSHNIWDSKTGQTLLIPQNSQLIGEYSSSIGHGQTRAQIVWNRIIFPNQQSVNLGSMVGVDKRGTSGTAGSVDNHYDKVALGLLLTTALGGSVRMAQGKYDPNTASMSQEFGNSLAQESARLGNKITDKMLSIQPTIKVPMGQRLNVFVEQDLSLQPYAG
jgi:type IV secretory pathway VirB10-like protein